MKKIYFAPETKLVKLKTKSKILAGSLKDTLGNEVVEGEDYARENSFIKPHSVWDE